jgi:hypothetical protein
MRSFKLIVAALAIVFGARCNALASIQIQAGDWIRMTDGIGRHGGVFHAQETNSTTSAFFGDSFQTFCVEFSEFVTLPRTYYVKSLGAAATASGNVLTNKAGWIYSNFLDGLLPYQNTITNATREMFHNSVQLAIWLEVANNNPANIAIGKQWIAADLARIYIQGGYDQGWIDAFLGITASGDHGVQMMNIRASAAEGAGHIQDQLVRNTRGMIPEPSALIVWSLLVGSVGVCTSRSRRSN